MSTHTVRRVVATIKQQHEIALLLGQHCSTGDSGTAVYAEGWSDQKIAEAVNEKLPNEPVLALERHVETRRKQVYGPMPSTKRSDLEARIVDLEGKLDHVIKQLETTLGSRYVKYKPPQGRPHSTPPE